MTNFPAVKVTGTYAMTERVSTGIYSLDVALGNPRTRVLGMPLRTYYEIYGNPHQGKSTLSYYLAGKIGGSLISLVDLEGFDPEYLSSAVGISGFQGEVRVVNPNDAKNVQRADNEMVQEMINTVLYTDECKAGIWDSIGAYIPVAEDKGDIGDAIMGRRAKDVAQACRRMVAITSTNKPGAFFVVNHVHSVIGGRGHTTPGGDTLKYLAGVRIMIWSQAVEVGSEKNREIVGYEIHGTVEKLKYGGKGRKFNCINLAGYGISPELSTMFDCFNLGLAERSTTVKIGNRSLGYISKMFEFAREGQTEKFAPFYELVEKQKIEENFIQEESEVEDDGTE